MAFAPCLKTYFFNGIGLREAVEFGLGAPTSVVVVVTDFAVGRVADDGVSPVRELNDQAGGLAAEEASGAPAWLRQTETPTGGGHGRRVANLGLYSHDMGHGHTPWEGTGGISQVAGFHWKAGLASLLRERAAA